MDIGIDEYLHQTVRQDQTRMLQRIKASDIGELIVGAGTDSPLSHFGFGFARCVLHNLLSNHSRRGERHSAADVSQQIPFFS